MTKTARRNNRNIEINSSWLMILMLVCLCSCVEKTSILASNASTTPSTAANVSVKPSDDSINKAEQPGSENFNQDNPLKKMLAAASWESMNEAKRQGKAALPVIRSFLNDENYRVRQTAVTSAGATGESEAADILAFGLKDSNINVRLAAARELSKQAYPDAAETVLEVIKTSSDQTVRDLLIKAAGFLPGENTLAVLRPLARDKSTETDKNFTANNAVYALAKLKDSQGHNLVADRLSVASPRTRYETLQNLCYVNDLSFVAKTKTLLSDKAEAIRVGSVRNSQTRRVADAAVDSLVCMLNLDLPFKPSKNLYTDEEINKVKNLVNKKE